MERMRDRLVKNSLNAIDEIISKLNNNPLLIWYDGWMFWKIEKSPEIVDKLPNGFGLTHTADWRPFIHEKYRNIYDVETFVHMGFVSLDFARSSHTLGANPCVAAAFLFKDNLDYAGVLHSRGNELPKEFTDMALRGTIVGGVVGGSKETFKRNEWIFQAAKMIYLAPTDNRTDFAVMAEPSSKTIFYSYENLPTRQR